MSVYTRVEREELEVFLRRYEIGRLVDFRGISAGIENTNYFVSTEDDEWVLTLFETVSAEELPYFLGLMDHLARRGLPTAAPLADRDGEFLQQLNERPAALVRRLPGASPEQPNAIQCEAMGEVLARMHEAAQDYPATRENSRGPAWWRPTAERLYRELPVEDARLLRDELAFQHQVRQARLPRGVIHGDLFHDNVLFEGNQLTGVSAEIITEDSFRDLARDEKLFIFGNGAAKCMDIIKHPDIMFIPGIYPSAGKMARLSYQALKKENFEDTAYFTPFYLKDFVATTPGKKIF